MSAQTIRVYNILKSRNFSDQEAQEVVDFVESSAKDGLATKEDIHGLKTEFKEDIHGLKTEFKEDIQALRTEFKEDIYALRTELKEDIQALRTELKEDIQALRTELKEDIQALRTELKEDIYALKADMANLKVDLIKWMMGVGVAAVIVVVGSIASLFKLYFQH
jgi:phage host-nuclease inhibitor protein Gam